MNTFRDALIGIRLVLMLAGAIAIGTVVLKVTVLPDLGHCPVPAHITGYDAVTGDPTC